MKRYKILAVLLASAVLLSGCSGQKENDSDTGDTDTSVSSGVGDTNSGNGGAGSSSGNAGLSIPEVTLDSASLSAISFGNQTLKSSVKLVAASNTPQATQTKVMDKEGDFYLCQPLYNLTNDTELDFSAGSGTKVLVSFYDSYNSAHYASYYDAEEVTGKVLRLSDIRKGLEQDLALYNFLVVFTEDAGVRTRYVIPFTMKGTLDVPSVAIDASEGTAYFSSAVELLTFGDESYSPLADKFDSVPFPDFNDKLISKEFEDELVETEDFISSPTYVPQGTALGLRKIATSSYNRVLYRAVDPNTREYSSWGVINLGDYANAIVSTVTVTNMTGPCGQAKSIDEWLALVPSQGTAETANGSEFSIPVIYTAPGGSVDELGNSLVAPGNTVINGTTIDTWMLEVGVGAQSTTGKGIFDGGSFTLFAFPKAFSEADCKTAIKRLVERQAALTEDWKANISKTMGLIQPSVYGAVTHSDTPRWSISSITGEMGTVSVPDDWSSDTESEAESEFSFPESTPSVPDVTSSDIEGTPSEAETSSNTESNPPAPIEENTEYQDILTEQLNSYTPDKGYITVPMSYGDVRFNGEDLGQIMVALYMFDGITEFEIPFGYFDMDKYETSYGNALSIVPDIVGTQNPMLPYVAESQIDVSADGQNAIFTVTYTSDADLLKKWQPLEYTAAKQIADKVSSYGSPAEKYLAINNELCQRAEYNQEAVKQATYRTDVIGKPEEIQYAWAPYGVLCEGLGVCYSYAQSFKLVCDMLDLPCLNVTGTLSGGGHIWNKVLIDGNWYIVDATNNDTTETEDMWKNTFCLVPDFVLSDLLCESEAIYFTTVQDNEDFKGTVNDKDCWSGQSVKRDELRDYVKANYKKGEDFAVRVSESLENYTPEELINSWSSLLVELYQAGEIDITERAGLCYSGNIFYIIET